MFGAQQLVVPMRDVLHVRLHDSRRHPRPLWGETAPPLLKGWKTHTDPRWLSSARPREPS
jgi:hypothetical protein